MPTTAAASTAAASTAAQSDVARKSLASNMDTFLKMLTTQLKNQDPLSPMDSTEFTAQLVQFANVEQQINANSNLEKLISLQKTSQMATGMQYIGQLVQVDSAQLPLQGGQASFSYDMPKGVDSATINLLNPAGAIVATMQADTSAGTHQITWGGLDKNGQPVADGLYSISIAAKGTDGKAFTGEIPTTVWGTVTNVGSTDDGIELSVGSLKTSLDKIKGAYKSVESGQLGQPLDYLGRTVEVESERIALTGGKSVIGYTLPKASASTTVTIMNSKGTVVATLTGATTKGVNSLTWDGKDKNGAKLDDGVYTVSVTAKDSSGNSLGTIPTTYTGQVTGITADGSGALLSLGSLDVSVYQVLRVRPAAS